MFATTVVTWRSGDVYIALRLNTSFWSIFRTGFLFLVNNWNAKYTQKYTWIISFIPCLQECHCKIHVNLNSSLRYVQQSFLPCRDFKLPNYTGFITKVNTRTIKCPVQKYYVPSLLGSVFFTSVFVDFSLDLSKDSSLDFSSESTFGLSTSAGTGIYAKAKPSERTIMYKLRTPFSSSRVYQYFQKLLIKIDKASAYWHTNIKMFLRNPHSN